MKYSLKKYNTFHTDTKSKLFEIVNTVEETISILQKYKDEKILILGEGSNTLFVNNYDGLIIKPNYKGIEVVKEDSENVYVKVHSGEIWDDFVKWCVERNYAGVENMAMIPGSVGSAVTQNIGAYGQTVIDTLYSIEAIDISKEKLTKFNPKKCGYRYRGSNFKHEWKNKYIVVSAIFKLKKNTKKFELSYTERAGRYGSLKEELDSFAKEPYSIQEVMKAIIMQRKKRLPSVKEYGTCGSFFENPIVSVEKYNELSKRISELQSYPVEEKEKVRIPAGRLLDELGWKGKWIGNVGTFDRHALCVVTNKKASGKEIYEYIQKMKDSVLKEYGVELISEVNIIL
ncbi:MAG: UDP-N-acetylmuramate dehydrogenase [Candidatus Dojkabacteria bacterium]|jgi:UDP-N-acetylmuramate dehydrogenase